LLKRHGPPVARPRTDDPHAANRLPLRHSVRTPSGRGGASQSGLPLVLRTWPQGRGAGTVELFQNTAWAVPRERCVPAGVRELQTCLRVGLVALCKPRFVNPIAQNRHLADSRITVGKQNFARTVSVTEGALAWPRERSHPTSLIGRVAQGRPARVAGDQYADIGACALIWRPRNRQ